MASFELLISAFFALMFILPVAIDFFRKLKKKQQDMGLERGPFDAEQSADGRTLDEMVERSAPERARAEAAERRGRRRRVRAVVVVAGVS